MNKNHKIVISAVILVIVIGGIYFLLPKPKPAAVQDTQSAQTATQDQTQTNSSSYEIQGMKVDILQQGTGEAAKTGDLVTVNYTGTLTDGTAFDSNTDPKFGHVQPFQFTLGQNSVIQGWELGVLGMKVGEKRQLTIPPELGYGSQSVGSIPANSSLIFQIDLLKIN